MSVGTPAAASPLLPDKPAWRRVLEGRSGRATFLLIVYSGIIALSFYTSYELRFDFNVSGQWRIQRMHMLGWMLPWKLACLLVFGQFGGMLRFFRLPDVYRLTAAMVLAALPLLLERYEFIALKTPVPRGVILTDYMLSLLMITTFRVSLRVVRERYAAGPLGVAAKQRRVAVVGAGDVGAMVIGDLLAKRGLGRRPIALFDDDRKKWRMSIHGIPVLGAPELIPTMKEKYEIEDVVIAMPSAPHRRIGEVIDVVRSCGLQAEIVPALDDLVSGRVKASRLRPVEIEDVLGRDPVPLDDEGIRAMIAGRCVMITGAGGSIGSELCRQVLRSSPASLVLVEQCEVLLFLAEQQLMEDGGGATLLPEIGDVLDVERMRTLFERHRPHLVFHAAAHKHVPLMERQPAEAIKNNTFGTQTVAELSCEFGVERFILISTDKAINPTSVMGTTKRLAEILVQGKQQDPTHRTALAAVRFGNVLGSSGSVVPIFRKQIDRGGPLTVTDPEVTRYFMTIPEAVGLVLQCAWQARGGEIFVLDMGKPVKIVDLARQMIRLSGYQPDLDIEIKFTGLRPGEKLFEELQHHGEGYASTSHPRIMRFTAPAPSYADVTEAVRQLREAVQRHPPREELKTLLKRFVPEYTPYFE